MDWGKEEGRERGERRGRGQGRLRIRSVTNEHPCGRLEVHQYVVLFHKSDTERKVKKEREEKQRDSRTLFNNPCTISKYLPSSPLCSFAASSSSVRAFLNSISSSWVVLAAGADEEAEGGLGET